MSDDSWETKIDAYVDSELPPEQMEAMQSHLRGCPACTSQMAERMQLKRAIAVAGRQFQPSAELRHKIQKQIAKRQRLGWRWLVPVAVAVALLLAILPNLRIGNEAPPQFREIADLHVAALAGTNPVDVVSSDRHTVKPWFQGRIPFSFDLPEVGGTPFTLLGGRMAYLEQSPGAQLIFLVRQHKISVFIFQDRPPLNRNLSSTHQNFPAALGFSGETWAARGLRYFVISDANADDVKALARLLESPPQR
jgi:anti-sigma factor RsiW